MSVPDHPVGASHFDLAICCRLYPRVSGRPIFGFKEKLDLVRLNLETLKESIGSLNVKIWFLLDKCPPAYEVLIRSIFTNQTIEIILLQGEGNLKTFGRQIDILTTQTDADLVYFAEDDYIYLPDGLATAVQFLRTHSDTDFITLYEHADQYTKYVHRHSEAPVRMGSQAWRPVASTCLTFLTTRAVLRETAPVFRTFCTGNSDLGLWLALTKRNVLNPWKWLRATLADGLFVGGSHWLAWRHAARYILGGKKRRLLAPAPSLATHMEITGLAPNINWEEQFKHRVSKTSANHQILP
jgi:hypothetical protein